MSISPENCANHNDQGSEPQDLCNECLNLLYGPEGD